jgi:hypothetical protein
MLLKMISYSTENAQEVTNDYLYEQAELLAYGATEYAILQTSKDDRTASCIESITLNYPPSTGNNIFDITILVQYVWLDTNIPAGTGCNNTAVTGSTVTVKTPEQNGSAYIDVTVTSASNLGLDEPIRFHRRTLQKL